MHHEIARTHFKPAKAGANREGAVSFVQMLGGGSASRTG